MHPAVVIAISATLVPGDMIAASQETNIRFDAHDYGMFHVYVWSLSLRIRLIMTVLYNYDYGDVSFIAPDVNT